MWDKLFSNSDNLAVFLALMIPIVAVVGHYWHEVLKHRADNELKRSLVERGMSAEEIEQVMSAGTKRSKKE